MCYTYSMNTKKALLIVAVAIVVGLVLWKAPKREAEAPTVQAPSEIAAVSSIAGAALNADGDFEYTKETEFVTIEAVYPAKTGLASEADIRARTTMENWIKAREADFLANANELLDDREQARLREQSRGYVMGIEYRAYTSGTNVSFVYQIYEDTGGAHPNIYYATFTFDADGRKIELADLFKPDSPYLEELSAFAYADILRQAPSRFGAALNEDQKDWVRAGTAPSGEMLQLFYLKGESLYLIFPPYQVAAYAAGTFDVQIRFIFIKGILK